VKETVIICRLDNDHNRMDPAASSGHRAARSIQKITRRGDRFMHISGSPLTISYSVTAYKSGLLKDNIHGRGMTLRGTSDVPIHCLVTLI